MRWSEQRATVHSTLRWLPHLHCERRALWITRATHSAFGLRSVSRRARPLHSSAIAHLAL